MVTAQEEAWEENFRNDAEKMVGEIISALNALLPRDKQVSRRGTGYIASVNYRDIGIGLNLLSALSTIGAKPSNPKIKWQINCSGEIGGKQFSFEIPVSHRDAYTKKEMERARNSIIKKLEELISKVV